MPYATVWNLGIAKSEFLRWYWELVITKKSAMQGGTNPFLTLYIMIAMTCTCHISNVLGIFALCKSSLYVNLLSE